MSVSRTSVHGENVQLKKTDFPATVIKHCIELGIKQFCVCAGARNAELIFALEALNQKIVPFFDERAASFFALGLSKSTQAPVAVVCTSGTAVSECSSAVIEAYYQNLPLVIISADRPKSYRGTGAPQAIEQRNIFGIYTPLFLDLDSTGAAAVSSSQEPIAATTNEFEKIKTEWNKKSPVHLNVCLADPLSKQAQQTGTESIGPSTSAVQVLEDPLVILGPLESNCREIVEDYLLKFSIPILAESLSGLRNSEKLSPLFLKAGELLLKNEFPFKSVLRIGNVPTTRVWRDLEDRLSHIPIISIAETQWRGVSRTSNHFRGISKHLELIKVSTTSEIAFKNYQLLESDKKVFFHFQELLQVFPQSEVAMFAQIAKEIEDSFVYIGNSLPIRQWDQVNWFKNNCDCYGNRGANGIDGQISSFLGWSIGLPENSHAVGIFGDLTALYDLNSLSQIELIRTQRPDLTISIVVVNNSGGRIFDGLFGSKLLVNEHTLRFEKWAELFNIEYRNFCTKSDFKSSKIKIIEMVPDNSQSSLFWKKWNADFHYKNQ